MFTSVEGVSNSDACPDNIWGWPSYGLREIVSSLGQRDWQNALRVTIQLLAEPILTETYTPRAYDVFNSIDREAARIGWSTLWRAGRAKAVRKTDDGRNAVAYTTMAPGAPPRLSCIIASYVHTAVGYPQFRVISAVQEYLERTQDFRSVVSAYEQHDQVYERLRRAGGTAIVSRRGIVASRIIQRLYEVRAENPDVQVLHLMRSPIAHRTRFQFAWRKTRYHCELQPFNWPKAAFGGTMRHRLEQSREPQRSTLLRRWGGTTTADRRDWQHIVFAGLTEGWYAIVFGEITRVERQQDGTLAVSLRGGESQQADFLADFLIVCTGLEGGWRITRSCAIWSSSIALKRTRAI